MNSPATSQDIYNFLATGEETNNSFFQFEAIVPTGGGPPLHIHSREDESFYVVSGSLEMGSAIPTYQAKAGDFVFIPRGTVHRFRNVGPGTAIQLVTRRSWVGVSGGPRGREEVSTRLARGRSRREEVIE